MSTFVSVASLLFAVLWMAFLSAGCAQTGAKVVSKSDHVTAGPGQRLLVVSQLAWTDQGWAEAFESALLSELRKAGINGAIQTRTPLAVQADKVRYAAQIAEFNPDVVLVVEPGDGTVDQRGRSLVRRFEAGLFRHYAERNRRELIWRATITLEPAGAYISPEDMSALARNLLVRLIDDGILPNQKKSVSVPAVTRQSLSPNPQ